MNSILLAKSISISTAFILSGYFTSASQNTLPNIYAAPASTSTSLFANVYYRGAALAIPASLIATGASAYLAYAAPAERTTYGVAAASVLSALVYTRIWMMPGIHRLIDLSNASTEVQAKAESSGEVLRLLKAWTMQNWLRAVMSAAGGMAALYAALTTV